MGAVLILIGALVFLILVFLGSIAVTIWTFHPPKNPSYASPLLLWMRRHFPDRMRKGEESNRQLAKALHLSDTTQRSLGIWTVRILAIIYAIVAGFAILWILGVIR